MAQGRYNRVFLLPEHLHCDGFPLEIEAGALLVDSKTDSVLAQLKMTSHADTNVKAVKVAVQPKDVKGDPLGDSVVHQYLDLDVKRSESFGQKTPIQFPDNNARSFSIAEIEVVYEDGRIGLSDSEWVPLPEQQVLGSSDQDEELIKQYKIDFGQDCIYQLQEMGDLWRCVCGATNRKDEETCYCCGRKLTDLRTIDPNLVRAHKESRLESEKVASETKRKRKKIAGIAVAIIAALVAVAYFVVRPIVVPASKYADAVAYMEAGDFDRASMIFEELGDYKDSPERVRECQYDRAVSLMDEGKYINAINAFEKLGGYKDSQARTRECWYRRAVSLMDEGSYDSAEEAFEKLGDYKDSQARMNECRAAQG